jgi:hypothetical protein
MIKVEENLVCDVMQYNTIQYNTMIRLLYSERRGLHFLAMEIEKEKETGTRKEKLDI